MTKHSIAGPDLYRWKQWAAQLAKANNVDQSEIDWLLQGLTPLNALSLRLGDYKSQTGILSNASLASLTEKWQQRVSDRIPVQYLVGETPWRNFSLTVTPAVLIPRPETELIIDIADKLSAQSPIADQCYVGDWADIGTGSGAIALGLADCFIESAIHAVDISQAALDIAKLNAKKNRLDHHIIFYQGSWLSPLSNLKERLVGIVSNPPYIPSSIVPTLQPEVSNHEPHIALDGGQDGLDYIKILIRDSPAFLKPGGIWLIELMLNQTEPVAALLKNHSQYTHIQIHKDLSGIQRFVSARKAL